MTSRTGFGGGGLDQSDGTTTAMTRHFHPGGGGHHGKYRAGDAYPPYPDSSSNTSSCNSSAPASPGMYYNRSETAYSVTLWLVSRFCYIILRDSLL